jgi:GNAT superfamily N-acetyltransferase
MDTPEPGHFWKTPFYWPTGSSQATAVSELCFTPAQPEWLLQAVAEVMATSADPSDQAAVEELGAPGAAVELLEVPSEVFEVKQDWWLRAERLDGTPIGFLLLALLKPEKYKKDGRTQGTIYYMGVLPGYRKAGYSVRLLQEAKIRFSALPCWRVFCDTGTMNTAMIKAFRSAGFEERAPWQRPLR